MDVSKDFRVSPGAAQSINRPPMYRQLWILLFFTLLVPGFEKELVSQTLLVSFCARPLDMTRHDNLPHSTSERRLEPRTNDSSILRMLR